MCDAATTSEYNSGWLDSSSIPMSFVASPAQRSLALQPADSPGRLMRPSTPEAPAALLPPPRGYDCYRVERSSSRAGLSSRCGPAPFYGALKSPDLQHLGVGCYSRVCRVEPTVPCPGSDNGARWNFSWYMFRSARSSTSSSVLPSIHSATPILRLTVKSSRLPD